MNHPNKDFDITGLARARLRHRNMLWGVAIFDASTKQAYLRVSAMVADKPFYKQLNARYRESVSKAGWMIRWVPCVPERLQDLATKDSHWPRIWAPFELAWLKSGSKMSIPCVPTDRSVRDKWLREVAT